MELVEKFCSRCRTNHPRAGFFKKSASVDGLAHWCKGCCVHARREWANKNREKIAGYDRGYYLRNSEALKKKTRRWAAENPERKAAADRAYREDNLEKVKDRQFAYRKANKARIAETKKRWKDKNAGHVLRARLATYWADPERFRSAAGSYKRANRARYNRLHADRKARKIQATPRWLTSEQRQVMQFMYDLARTASERLGQPYHVDHFVPLRGKGVCGLHVPWNLRALPAIDNMRKNNELPAELQGWRRPDGSRVFD